MCNNCPLQSRKRQAFTLIELLVVISIISLLIAILLPALRSARESVMDVSCLSLLRQYNMANAVYEVDFSGFVMPVVMKKGPASSVTETKWLANHDWLQGVGLTSGDIGFGNVPIEWICPRAEYALGRPNTGYTPSRYPLQYAYGANVTPFTSTELLDASVQIVYPMHQISNPSDKIVLADSMDWWIRSSRSQFYVDEVNRVTSMMIAYRHTGNANLAMFDGHCESMPRELLDINYPTSQATKYWEVFK